MGLAQRVLWHFRVCMLAFGANISLLVQIGLCHIGINKAPFDLMRNGFWRAIHDGAEREIGVH